MIARPSDGWPSHRSWFTLAHAMPCVVLGVAVATQWAARFVMDDSLMFVRYADHLLGGEGLAWNRGDDPVYGPTSLAYVWVVAIVRLFADSVAMAVQLSSVLCGAAFVFLVSRLAREAGGANGQVASVVTLTALAFWSDSLSAHFTTGMDTTFAMAFLAGFLLMAGGVESGRSGYAMGTSIGGGLALAVRPELCLFTVLVPAVAAMIGPSSKRRVWGAVGAGTIGIFLAHVLLAWGVLGTPLPLSFYTKSVHGYGAGFASEYGHVALAEFVDFASGYWLLILPIAIGLCFLRERKERSLSVEIGVLAATVLFLFYHLFMTLPIMPYKERFFHPVLPAFAYLAGRAMSGFQIGTFHEDVRSRLPLVTALFVAAILSSPGIASAKAFRKGVQAGAVGAFDLVETYRATSQSDRWFALDRFSELPDDLVISATEIGLPAALNPGKRIVDMAGLNHRSFAVDGFDLDQFFDEGADLVFLPHPHYIRIIRMLRADGRWSRRYRVIEAETTGTEFGVALLEASPHYDRMRRIVDEAIP